MICMLKIVRGFTDTFADFATESAAGSPGEAGVNKSGFFARVEGFKELINSFFHSARDISRKRVDTVLVFL